MPRYRHPSLPGAPATERITLWLPKAERDTICRLAREAGLSVSAFLRELARAEGQGDAQQQVEE
jgi:hypothetical protein